MKHAARSSNPHPTGASQVGRDAIGRLFAKFQFNNLEQLDMLELAVSSYGHLIERNETLSLRAFAHRIKARYSYKVPRNAAVVNALLCNTEPSIVPN